MLVCGSGDTAGGVGQWVRLQSWAWRIAIGKVNLKAPGATNIKVSALKYHCKESRWPLSTLPGGSRTREVDHRHCAFERANHVFDPTIRNATKGRHGPCSQIQLERRLVQQHVQADQRELYRRFSRAYACPDRQHVPHSSLGPAEITFDLALHYMPVKKDARVHGVPGFSSGGLFILIACHR